MQIFGPPRRPEFDQYSIKFIVGFIALSLPIIEWLMTNGNISSISESYWSEQRYGPWPRNIFVGFLFSIAALLLSFNGTEEVDMWLGKIAALCAVLIPMFPCGCAVHPEIIPHLHIIAAGVMFAVLAAFCIIFWKRAKKKVALGNRAARLRMWVYAACCAGTVMAIGFFFAFGVTKEKVLVYYGEALGLISFGVSWLTASKFLPILTTPAERNSLIGKGPAGPALTNTNQAPPAPPTGQQSLS